MSGQTRVMVQVGQCSQALGAEAVAQGLGETLVSHNNAYLVTTGCDGACFAAPQVVVNEPDGRTRHYSSVSVSDVPEIVAALGDGEIVRPTPALEDFFTPQHLQVMSWCGQLEPANVDDYVTVGGYASLAEALSGSPEDVIDRVLESGLQGRGGAYFPPLGSGRGPAPSPVPGSWWSTQRRVSRDSSKTAILWRACLTACWKAP